MPSAEARQHAAAGAPAAPRTRAFRVVLVVVCWALLETSALLALRLAGALHVDFPPIPVDALSAEDRTIVEQLMGDESTYVVYSAPLGWTLRPNGISTAGYRANADGLRAERVYDRSPPADAIRIAAFGDSHVHCDEVENADTWEEQLAGLVPRLEVLNFGVGGYGPDQAYLRWREHGRAFAPDIVLIGFMSENINRVVNVFRSFYSPGSPLTKPRFVLDAGRLRLLPNPFRTLEDYRRLLAEPARVLPELGADDFWFQTMPHASRLDVLPSVRLTKTARYVFQRWAGPGSIVGLDGVYRPETEALALVKAILAAFRADVLAHGALPIVVLFPSHRDVARFLDNGRRRYQPLVDDLTRRGDRFVDLLDAFAAAEGRYQPGDVFAHYTAAENGVVARHLAGVLEQSGLSDRARVRRAAAEERSRVSTADGAR